MTERERALTGEWYRPDDRKLDRLRVESSGSVVTRDIPNNVVVADNPARIIRHLEEEAS